jgi:hypothetical protein
VTTTTSLAPPDYAPVPRSSLGPAVNENGSYADRVERNLYRWTRLIGGHMGRLGTREDAVLHQHYVADMDANCRPALTTVDPTPHFEKYGENNWAAVKSYLDAVTDAAAAPVIAKYTGVLGAADVFTISDTFAILESIRLDHGYGSWIHP